MTAKEIIQLESSNYTHIYLLHEGVFWKAYEKSAFAFFSQIREYKPVRKWLQVLKGDLISLGFPVTSAKTVLEDANVLLHEKDRIVLSASPVEQHKFMEWKQAVPLAIHEQKHTENKSITSVEHLQHPLIYGLHTEMKSSVETAVLSSSCSYEGMVDSIRRFNIANKTPVDCMLFLMELKRKLSV